MEAVRECVTREVFRITGEVPAHLSLRYFTFFVAVPVI